MDELNYNGEIEEAQASELESLVANSELEDDIEPLDGEVALDDSDLTEEERAVLSEEEQFAYKIVRKAAGLKAVRIDRDVFLRTELRKHCPDDVVANAIETTPQQAGIPLDVMDKVADSAIALETKKVSGLSALAGIPGGLAMFGTVPADLVNYFAHVLRIEQKLAYAYGWQSFLDDEDEIDDETMTKLIIFLGIIMQVGGVNVSLTHFAAGVAMKGVAKTIEKQALTKTAWYPVLKRVLSVIGVKVTKQSFAEVAAKGVPIAGGLISGGITYATFKPGAISLKNHLRLLPQATGSNMSDEEVLALLNAEDEREKAAREQRINEAKEAAVAIGGKAINVAKAGAGFAAETAGAVAASVGGVLGGFAAKIGKKKADDESAPDVDSQLRSLKSLLDDGIISQEDFDAKKRKLLGLD